MQAAENHLHDPQERRPLRSGANAARHYLPRPAGSCCINPRQINPFQGPAGFPDGRMEIGQGSGGSPSTAEVSPFANEQTANGDAGLTSAE